MKYKLQHREVADITEKDCLYNVLKVTTEQSQQLNHMKVNPKAYLYI